PAAPPARRSLGPLACVPGARSARLRRLGARRARRMKRALSPAEASVSDVVGRLMEFWGFKRNMGRVWAVLYLSPEPMSAEDLRHALKLSSGAISMTLSELSRWGVVRKVWVQGERKEFYGAEVQLWRMISRVFNEREKAEIMVAIDSFTEALAQVERSRATSDAK